MGYRIEAFLKDGVPSLNIYDLDANTLCLAWQYHSNNSNSNSDDNLSRQQVHELFRKLLLLTCKQEKANMRVFKLKTGSSAVSWR